MEVVRVGVIGIGVMGERHCRVCANLPRVDLVGIADLNEERGQEVADRYETAYYPDYRQLLPRLPRKLGSKRKFILTHFDIHLQRIAWKTVMI